MSKASLGFLPKPLMLAVESVLLSVKLDPHILTSHKFRQIRESIVEIGLIELLVVTALYRKTGRHLLLDGPLRLHAMKEVGHESVPCIVSTDDESFTYNNRISRLFTIQEHAMIRHAIDQGIPAAKLAKGLSMDISLLLKKGNLLEGICAEIIEIPKDQNFSTEMAPILRRMKPTRQIECAELMIAANNLSASYARALLAATLPEMQIEKKSPSS